MRIHDTFSGSEKELDISGIIRIYLCGITAYDDSHIGHARTIIVFDVLRKFLESQDLKVKFVQNFTDVDDKIINKAKAENKTASEISEKYIQNYFEDFDTCAAGTKTIPSGGGPGSTTVMRCTWPLSSTTRKRGSEDTERIAPPDPLRT